MKKLFGVILVLIVIKCFGMTNAANFSPIVLNQSEIPFEGVISIIIAIGIIYGAKVGREEEVKE
ncbi:hypothetical protein [Parasediminibacterium sp. JCM 36343]|uniref:hypothetical protein n=1 Tax=Parasediminibacterium sp. JCM 36343 TaxID=3374279 RepID=UPI00397A9B52